MSGCDVFVHHFDTVDGLTPICSESHLQVRLFSTKTSLIRFTSSIVTPLGYKFNDYFSFSLFLGNKSIYFILKYLNRIGDKMSELISKCQRLHLNQCQSIQVLCQSLCLSQRVSV